MRPLIDKASVDRVDAAVQAAIDAGAEVIVRGGPSKSPDAPGGSDVSLPIVQEETFGPVQTSQGFDTEDETVALANHSEYGLSACIWSRDVDTPMRVARRLAAGLISINSCANLAVGLRWAASNQAAPAGSEAWPRSTTSWSTSQ